MFTWPEIVLLILRIAQAVMNQINSQTFIAAGKAEEIALVSSAILARVHEMQAIAAKVNALPEAEVDNELKGLEPK
jgi:hypothetical protein